MGVGRNTSRWSWLEAGSTRAASIARPIIQKASRNQLSARLTRQNYKMTAVLLAVPNLKIATWLNKTTCISTAKSTCQAKCFRWTSALTSIQKFKKNYVTSSATKFHSLTSREDSREISSFMKPKEESLNWLGKMKWSQIFKTTSANLSSLWARQNQILLTLLSIHWSLPTQKVLSLSQM